MLVTEAELSSPGAIYHPDPDWSIGIQPNYSRLVYLLLLPSAPSKTSLYYSYLSIIPFISFTISYSFIY